MCRVHKSSATGRVSAELLCPYPPGVPLLFPGEVISSSALDALHATLQSGGYIAGSSDPRLDHITVMCEDSKEGSFGL